MQNDIASSFMRTKMTQVEFDLFNYKSQIGKPFGGSRRKGNPKGKRPFSRKHLIHLILKSSHAKGRHSFLHPKNRKSVDQLVRRLARKFGVDIRDYVNVANHLHLAVRASHRVCLTRFLRSLCGLLPRGLLGCEKGKPLGFVFWDARPFTKIIAEGRKPFQIIRRYFDKNRRQAQRAVEGFDILHQLNTT
jgi:REP element-mobilizing transposase RayT